MAQRDGNPQSAIHNPQLAAQRPPEAMWLWLVSWRKWQRNKKPVVSGDWLVFDVGLFTDPAKRGVWAAHGPAAAVGLMHLMAAIGGDAGGYASGLIYADRRYLAAVVPELVDVGTDWLIEAGWALYLTDEQAEVIRSGGTVEDLTMPKDGRARAVFEALAQALSRRWGRPRTSHRSEALYWRPHGRRGEQVRLAMHRRRRSADTVCDVIIHPEEAQRAAGDIDVPLDKPIDIEAVAGRIVAEVGGKKGANSSDIHDSTKPHSRAKNAETTNSPAPGCSVKKRRYSAEKRDSSQRTRNTVQYSTEQYSTEQIPDHGPGASHTGTHPSRALAGYVPLDTQTGTTPDRSEPQNPPDGNGHTPGPGSGARQPDNPQKPEAGGPVHGSPPRRRRAAPRASFDGHGCRLGDVHAIWWRDPESLAFGERIFETLWPGRDKTTRDASSEIGTFAKFHWERIRPLPAAQQQQSRCSALKHAIERHKHGKSDKRPGAVLMSVLTASAEKRQRASPQAAQG